MNRRAVSHRAEPSVRKPNACRRWLALVALAAIVADAGAAGAQMGLTGLFGDVEAGRQVAASNCSQCHALDRGEAGQPLDAPPNFADLARLKLSRQALIESLNHNPVHVNPPPPATRFFFTTSQIENLSAYMESLETGD